MAEPTLLVGFLVLHAIGATIVVIQSNRKSVLIVLAASLSASHRFASNAWFPGWKLSPMPTADMSGALSLTQFKRGAEERRVSSPFLSNTPPCERTKPSSSCSPSWSARRTKSGTRACVTTKPWREQLLE
jgi:hypothetical protein